MSFMGPYAVQRPSRRGRNRQNRDEAVELPVKGRYYGASPPAIIINPAATQNHNGKGRKNKNGNNQNAPNQGKKHSVPVQALPIFDERALAYYGAGGKHRHPAKAHPQAQINFAAVHDAPAVGYYGSGADAARRTNPVTARPFTHAAHQLGLQHPRNKHNNVPWPPPTPSDSLNHLVWPLPKKASNYNYERACVLADDGKPLFDKTTTSDSFYLKYLGQISQGVSELHPVFRSRALQQLLDVGSVEQVCAEVFHFISGVLQCKYGDGYMRDDLTMCDCNGTVPVCFMRAYLDMRERAEAAEARRR